MVSQKRINLISYDDNADDIVNVIKQSMKLITVFLLLLFMLTRLSLLL